MEAFAETPIPATEDIAKPLAIQVVIVSGTVTSMVFSPLFSLL